MNDHDIHPVSRNNSLRERIHLLFPRISRAAMRAGKKPEDIKLITVTKTVGVDAIRSAIDAGLKVFGESRVQEAKAKIAALGPQTADLGVVWHLIGHLQKNKARYAVRLFDLIHSLDSPGLAKELDRRSEEIGKVQDLLVEVKLSGEETKHGIAKDRLIELLEAVGRMRNLNARGLMTIPPFSDEPENSRAYFRELRRLRDEATAQGFHLPDLSMGMSNDFEVAIEEGATMVRIGTALFGERQGKNKEDL